MHVSLSIKHIIIVFHNFYSTFRNKQAVEEVKGYSVNKLANMAGVSQSYLRDIELGAKNPTISFISLLCEQL